MLKFFRVPIFLFPQVDAKKILKPFSHDKYIKEPEPGVVFVNRRDGLVPLFSLGR